MLDLVDTHCHLDFKQFRDDREEVYQRFLASGGRWLLVVAVDHRHVHRLRSLAESYTGIYFSVGLHPNQVADPEPSAEDLYSLAQHERCRAIGETGLDYYRHHVPPEAQQARFRMHIQVAKSLSLPVIVHMREADADVLRILREEGLERGVMHCFSSDWATAKAALDLGMYLSFSGNITYKGNDTLRQVAAKVPEDRLLIETDSPYLAPMPHRGKRNEPAYVRYVAECIASVRGIPVDALASLTARNAERLFLS